MPSWSRDEGQFGNFVIGKFCNLPFFAFEITNYPITKLQIQSEFMANTTTLSRAERKKTKRAARKKRKAEKPLKPRDYARGSKKRKVKKMARGQSKR